MFDPLLGLGAFAAALLRFPAAPVIDPGPSPECPNDMRLVTGKHHDEMEHLCVDPRTDAKTTHCFSYFEGISAEGAPSPYHVSILARQDDYGVNMGTGLANALQARGIESTVLHYNPLQVLFTSNAEAIADSTGCSIRCSPPTRSRRIRSVPTGSRSSGALATGRSSIG